MGEQAGMSTSGAEIVGLNWKAVEQGLDESGMRRPPPRVGELDPDEQLRGFR